MISKLAAEIASDKNKQIELLKTASRHISDLEHKLACHEYVINEIEMGKVASAEDAVILFNEISSCDNIEIYKTAREMGFQYEAGLSDSDFNMDYYFGDSQGNLDKMSKDDAINEIKNLNK